MRLTRAARQNDETSRKLEDVQLYLDCIAKLTKMVTGGDDKEEVVLNLTKQILWECDDVFNVTLTTSDSNVEIADGYGVATVTIAPDTADSEDVTVNTE